VKLHSAPTCTTPAGRCQCNPVTGSRCRQDTGLGGFATARLEEIRDDLQHVVETRGVGIDRRGYLLYHEDAAQALARVRRELDQRRTQ